jgi:hypothetical protein
MTDLRKLASQHKDVPDEVLKKAGQAIGGDMDEEHRTFVQTIARLIEGGEIDVYKPETFFRLETYGTLAELDRAQMDRATVNVADQLRRIHEFYRSKQTPDESPHLQTMVEHLWQMKSRVEEKYGDVYKF